MIRRLLYWLSGFLPGRLINGNDGSRQDVRPYLERYFIATLFGCFAYLHRFVHSDWDDCPHDHPFKWALSLVLSGGYIELRVIGMNAYGPVCRSRMIKPCRFNWFGPHIFHRVIVPEGKEGWTLFLHGPRTKTWGFLEMYAGGMMKFREDKPGTGEYPWWEHAPKGRDLAREPA